MVRVPTYANYDRLLNQSMKTKSMIDMYSYQAVSGIKYANYAGYGMSASNIVNMEASINVTQTFMDNNTILNTTISALSTVMETVEDTVSGFKSQLNNTKSALTSLKNGEAVTSEVSIAVSELQTVAFSAMSLLSDALNTSVGGKYIFGAGSSSAPTDFPFSSLDEFQQYYDGINITYPTTENANLSSRNASWKTSGDLTIAKDTSQDAPDNQFILSSTEGFTSTAVVGGKETTGTLTFSAGDKTLKSTVYGAFNAIGDGDTLIFTDSNGVSKSYIVDKVSQDGKTITFTQDTVVEDATYPDGFNDAASTTPISIGTSFAVGTVLNYSPNGKKSVDNQTMQVVGIEPDGSLKVTTNPSRFDLDTLPLNVEASNGWTLESQTYYVGGSADETYRISDNQSIRLDYNANDSVFDRLFRAFGMMSQGNFIKTNPDDGTLANAEEIENLVTEAMSILQSAIDNNGQATDGTNQTLSLVIAKISSNYVTLDNAQKTLEAVQGNLEDNVSSIRNADKTEATVKLLEAQNSLEASYQVLNNVLNLSLLNYMD